MLKALFYGMLEASNAYYGDAIGLAPVALSAKSITNKTSRGDYWSEECDLHPTRIACLNYDT